MKKLLSLFVALHLVSMTVFAKDVHVAVAANFATPLEKMALLFATKTGHHIIPSVGSTANLYTQVKNGAPFEVFLSADTEHVDMLVKNSLATKDSRFTYAIGQLVLWSMDAKLVDASGDVLKSGTFQHLAIANPKLAPYGLAAKEVLEKRGLWKGLQTKIVMGESIGQTQQFIVSHNAELGFVALSQIQNPPQAPVGSYWKVPQDLYSPLRQDAVLLNLGAKNSAATDLLNFLKTDDAKKILKEYGYELAMDKK